MKKLILTISTIIIILTLNFFIKKPKSNKIIVSEVTHSIFYAPWYVALENGYFKDEGLDIDVILTPGADKVATAVLSGDANIGFSGPEATIYVYNNSKEKLKTFAALTKRDGQFIVGNCELKNKFTMDNLISKKILAGRKGGMPLMMFEYALNKTNIDKNLIDIDSSIDFAALTGAYIGKQGDFVNLFEPNATKLEKEGYGCVLASLGEITGIVPYTTFYAKESYINSNKENLEKFNKALNKGLKFVKENDSEKIANSIIYQFPNTTLSDLITIIDRYKKADSWYETTYININDFNRLQDIMIYGKSINQKINPNILITNEFN